MPKWAIDVNGTVKNIIVARTKEDAEVVAGPNAKCVQFDDSDPIGVEWVWNEESNTYTPPVIPNTFV